MFNFSWFNSSKEEQNTSSTWNPNTLTMEQPSSPSAPVAQQNQGVITEQPVCSLTFFSTLELADC